jgi:hypothetical protein
MASVNCSNEKRKYCINKKNGKAEIKTCGEIEYNPFDALKTAYCIKNNLECTTDKNSILFINPEVLKSYQVGHGECVDFDFVWLTAISESKRRILNIKENFEKISDKMSPPNPSEIAKITETTAKNKNLLSFFTIISKCMRDNATKLPNEYVIKFCDSIDKAIDKAENITENQKLFDDDDDAITRGLTILLISETNITTQPKEWESKLNTVLTDTSLAVKYRTNMHRDSPISLLRDIIDIGKYVMNDSAGFSETTLHQMGDLFSNFIPSDLTASDITGRGQSGGFSFRNWWAGLGGVALGIISVLLMSSAITFPPLGAVYLFAGIGFWAYSYFVSGKTNKNNPYKEALNRQEYLWEQGIKDRERERLKESVLDEASHNELEDLDLGMFEESDLDYNSSYVDTGMFATNPNFNSESEKKSNSIRSIKRRIYNGGKRTCKKKKRTCKKKKRTCKKKKRTFKK